MTATSPAAVARAVMPMFARAPPSDAARAFVEELTRLREIAA
jgi:hypothetical protein